MPITYLSYADLDADYEDIDCEDCGRKFFVDPKIQERIRNGNVLRVEEQPQYGKLN